MHTAKQKFIPILSSDSGMTLTAENWQEVGCDMAAFNLESLLLKPGYSLLSSLSDWRAYLGWSKSLILNLSALRPNKEGVCTLISPYDGSRVKIEYTQLIKLMMDAKADKVILPPNILRDIPNLLDSWNEDTMPYFSVYDLQRNTPSAPHGIYFSLNNPQADFIDELKQWSHLSRYACGSIDFDLMQTLKDLSVDFIESDAPATAGINGLIYSPQGVVDLKQQPLESMPFEPIDSQCSCPTCAAGLTQAYLHHLYHHTPLLCQRFLIQHNVYTQK